MRKPLIVQSLHSKKIPRFPVWLMRQAGRYLREYQEMKEQYSFLELCKTPELAFEVTMQPLRAFPVDAAILFSDILLPAEVLGFRVDFRPGPIVDNPIRQADEVRSLSRHDIAAVLSPVLQTIKMLRAELDGEKALIGFAGAPWTLACYLIDQGPYKHFHGTQIFARSFPNEFETFFAALTDVIREYCVEQARAGADVIQLFDSWGGILSLEDYQRYSLPGIQKIISALNDEGIPNILYVNGSSHLLPALKTAGATAVSVDWRTPLGQAELELGDSIAIQGNFDPTALFDTREGVATGTRAMLEGLKRKTGFIANLGHGVLQATPRENVEEFVNSVHSFSLT